MKKKMILSVDTGIDDALDVYKRQDLVDAIINIEGEQI